MASFVDSLAAPLSLINALLVSRGMHRRIIFIARLKLWSNCGRISRRIRIEELGATLPIFDKNRRNMNKEGDSKTTSSAVIRMALTDNREEENKLKQQLEAFDIHATA